eukprot:gene6383-2564_t
MRRVIPSDLKHEVELDCKRLRSNDAVQVNCSVMDLTRIRSTKLAIHYRQIPKHRLPNIYLEARSTNLIILDPQRMPSIKYLLPEVLIHHLESKRDLVIFVYIFVLCSNVE